VKRRIARLAGLALLAGALACRPTATPTGTPTATAAGKPRVTIDSPSGRSTVVEVELARTPEELERGLMFRERLGPGAGMLFVFRESSDHAFWMKNTLIPLDMVFIDEAGAVVGVVERAEPLSLVPRAVGRPSRYVLEVAGGFAAAHAIRAGDQVRFEGL